MNGRVLSIESLSLKAGKPGLDSTDNKQFSSRTSSSTLRTSGSRDRLGGSLVSRSSGSALKSILKGSGPSNGPIGDSLIVGTALGGRASGVTDSLGFKPTTKGTASRPGSILDNPFHPNATIGSLSVVGTRDILSALISDSERLLTASRAGTTESEGEVFKAGALVSTASLAEAATTLQGPSAGKALEILRLIRAWEHLHRGYQVDVVDPQSRWETTLVRCCRGLLARVLLSTESPPEPGVDRIWQWYSAKARLLSLRLKTAGPLSTQATLDYGPDDEADGTQDHPAPGLRASMARLSAGEKDGIEFDPPSPSTSSRAHLGASQSSRGILKNSPRASTASAASLPGSATIMSLDEVESALLRQRPASYAHLRRPATANPGIGRDGRGPSVSRYTSALARDPAIARPFSAGAAFSSGLWDGVADLNPTDPGALSSLFSRATSVPKLALDSLPTRPTSAPRTSSAREELGNYKKRDLSAAARARSAVEGTIKPEPKTSSPELKSGDPSADVDGLSDPGFHVTGGPVPDQPGPTIGSVLSLAPRPGSAPTGDMAITREEFEMDNAWRSRRERAAREEHFQRHFKARIEAWEAEVARFEERTASRLESMYAARLLPVPPRTSSRSSSRPSTPTELPPRPSTAPESTLKTAKSWNKVKGVFGKLKKDNGLAALMTTDKDKEQAADKGEPDTYPRMITSTRPSTSQGFSRPRSAVLFTKEYVERPRSRERAERRSFAESSCTCNDCREKRDGTGFSSNAHDDSSFGVWSRVHIEPEVELTVADDRRITPGFSHPHPSTRPLYVEDLSDDEKDGRTTPGDVVTSSATRVMQLEEAAKIKAAFARAKLPVSETVIEKGLFIPEDRSHESCLSTLPRPASRLMSRQDLVIPDLNKPATRRRRRRPTSRSSSRNGTRPATRSGTRRR